MRPNSRKKEYVIWLHINKTLPWIELEGIYDTLPDAWRAIEGFKKNLRLKVVEISKPPLTEDVLAVQRVHK